MHIPFWVASRGAGFSFQREEKLHATLKVASSAVGEIIRLKDALLSPLTQTYVTQHLLPFLNRHLLRVHHRVTECYAWILVAARLVSTYNILHAEEQKKTRWMHSTEPSSTNLSDSPITCCMLACVTYSWTVFGSKNSP